MDNLEIIQTKLKAVVVLSGGLDSTTSLYWALTQYDVVGAISFNYGQKHSVELDYAKATCKKLKISHLVQEIKIPDTRSSLANKNIEVPEGHYSDENMKVTVVNNRNSIMFSFATAYAIEKQADRVVVGIHAGDHFIYPDCRTDFIKSFNQTMVMANEGFISPNFAIIAPFVNFSKTDIAELGILLGLDPSETYSDYDGGKVQRAHSGTSVERIEALSEGYMRIAKLTEAYTNYEKLDPTKYEDKKFALNLLIERAKEARKENILCCIAEKLLENFSVVI